MRGRCRHAADRRGRPGLAGRRAGDVGTSARNLVLLGDPQQLAQVAQGGHPEATAVSALGHLLGERADDAGTTAACSSTSAGACTPTSAGSSARSATPGELDSLAECAQPAGRLGRAVRRRPRAFLVDTPATAATRPEEADVIAEQVALLAGGTVTPPAARSADRARRRDGGDALQRPGAAVRSCRRRLPDWVDVGTVDKFQGREAAVVFFSMATSSGEDMPRERRVPALAQPAERGRSRGRSAWRCWSRARRCSRSDAGRSSRCGWRTRCAVSWRWRTSCDLTRCLGASAFTPPTP